MLHRFAALLAFSCLALLAFPAFAADPEGHVSLGLLAGYGVATEPNVLGPGAGVRLGYTFPFGLYTGVVGLAHLGTQDDGEPNTPHHRAQSLRAELGYDIHVPYFTLRPALSFGAARVDTTRDDVRHFITPDFGLGLSLLHPIGHYFIGASAEARYLSRPVHNGDDFFPIETFAAYGTVGYTF